MSDKKFRFKGRQLGTAIGEREHQQARSERRFSQFETAVGAVSRIGAIAAYASGDIGTGSLLMLTAPSGSADRAEARSKAAHGTAVESLIAKSRGGSAALGDKGIVPPKPSTDRMAGFNRANKQYAASRKAATAAPQGGSGNPNPGWSKNARIGAAKAKGYQNLPYGGQTDPSGNSQRNPDDGTGQN